MTVNNLTISTLREPLALIEAMQDAYRRGVWRKDYILIYETVTPAETLLLLSRSAGTKLLLTADTKVAPAGLADIAGKFSLSYQSEDLMRFASGGQPLFYNAYRVKESFWTGNLAAKTFAADDPTGGILDMSENESTMVRILSSPEGYNHLADVYDAAGGRYFRLAAGSRQELTGKG